MDDLEIIKENVQPLRQGRKIESVRAGLSSDSIEVDKRESIRAEYENNLKKFVEDREKLFETYYEYINWIEQNYPSGKMKIKYNKILENCIQTFYKNENYRNDERMLSIFLNYIDILDEPLTAFSFFFKTGFAKKLARFYIEWSYHLEQQDNFKKALQVLKDGVEKEAQPLQLLKKSLNDLEVRTLQHASNNPDETNNKRKALNKLKVRSDSSGKTVASIKRKITENTGGGLTKISNNIPQKQNEEIQIFVDDNQDDKNENNCNIVDNPKENKLKIERWCDIKLDLKKNKNVENNKFEIFVDSNETKEQEPKEKILVAKFESADILKQYVWYNMINEIYRDGTEYSFEELRCQKWYEKQRKQLIEKQHENTTQYGPILESYENKSFVGDRKNSSAIVRGFFVDTLYQTQIAEKTQGFEENFDLTKHDTTRHENLEILEDDCNTTAKVEHNFTKTNEFNSCSSSTPFLNKTLKSQQNMARRFYNNPHFVSGITCKLSTIIETSREDFSKSSSSSSSSSSGTISSVGCTTKKILIDPEIIKNPFDLNTKKSILSSISEPLELRKNYLKISSEMPKFQVSEKFLLNNQQYIVMDRISKSENKSIFIYTKVSQNDLDKEDVELNSLIVYQNNNDWEFYIYDELSKSLLQRNSDPDIELSLITLDRIIFYEDGHLLYHELNLNNSLANYLQKFQTRHLKFPATVLSLIIVELILIIQKIHDCGFIHSNINIENIILNYIEKDDLDSLPKRTSFIKMVDFSQAIDMRVLPDGIKFDENFKTENFYSVLNQKPWNYQIDWIGFLNCIHWMAFGCEMKIIPAENNRFTWSKLFEPDFFQFNQMFDMLLNLEANQKPNLQIYIHNLISYIKQNKTLLREDLFEIFSIHLF